MKIYHQLVALLFILLTTKQLTFAQDNTYPFTHLDVGKGLSHNRVTNIVKDEKGFLWFGTANGLNRFDGYKFKVYKHQPADSTSLNEDFISSIQHAPGNKLWIRTQIGYSIYDPLTDSFSSNLNKFLKPLGLPDARIQKIIKAGNGDFYFLHAAYGLYIYEHATLKTKNIRYKKGAINSLHAAGITDITSDFKGNIWLIYNDGFIEKLNSKSGKILYRNFLPLNLATKQKVDNYSIFVDKQEDLWVYSNIKPFGVIYFNTAKGVFKSLSRESTEARLIRTW